MYGTCYTKSLASPIRLAQGRTFPDREREAQGKAIGICHSAGPRLHPLVIDHPTVVMQHGTSMGLRYPHSVRPSRKRCHLEGQRPLPATRTRHSGHLWYHPPRYHVQGDMR